MTQVLEPPSLKIRQGETHSTANYEWSWPFDQAAYDRNPVLTSIEQTELAAFVGRRRNGDRAWRQTTRTGLERLLLPLGEVLDFSGVDCYNRVGVLGLLLEEMHTRQSSFWAWTEAEWAEFLNTQFTRIHLLDQNRSGGYPHYLLVVGYILGKFANIYALTSFVYKASFARKVFGSELVDSALKRVREEAIRIGYGPSRPKTMFPRMVGEALVLNRNPYLESLTLEQLEMVRQHSPACTQEDCFAFSRVLESLSILPKALPPKPRRTPDFRHSRMVEDVPAPWLNWCLRWYDTSTLSLGCRRHYYYVLLKVGRWLAQHHPEGLDPGQWSRELAAEYVAVVVRMTIGQLSQAGVRPALAGKPLSARSRSRELCALRTFFRDGQEWEWFKCHFDPQRCFATPRPVRALIAPNPRVIEEDLWAKLLWAGLNLSEDDLPKGRLGQLDPTKRVHFYPLELVRALVIVWLFAGLRSDEIYRLRVGCVRWQSPVTQEAVEHRSIKPEATSAPAKPRGCLLEVPVNKTSTAFTKPVDRLVGEAINAWEKLRPSQNPLLDGKTGEMVDLLFAYRGKRLGHKYLNKRIIPILCHKAGIPQSDHLGTITSHRARSTIATQLFNAPQPMSLFELQQWLGHHSAATTQHYAKINPTKLTKAYTEAGYFEHNLRNIKVLIDQEAIKSGAVVGGEAWKFYDLGHGYCTYDFFDQCPHRMACAKCAFYRPKGSSQAQLLEAKVNLLHLRQDIPLNEAERAAVDDGLKALERLCEQLADTPTPAGPTPRELELMGKRQLPVVR